MFGVICCMENGFIVVRLFFLLRKCLKPTAWDDVWWDSLFRPAKSYVTETENSNHFSTGSVCPPKATVFTVLSHKEGMYLLFLGHTWQDLGLTLCSGTAPVGLRGPYRVPEQSKHLPHYVISLASGTLFVIMHPFRKPRKVYVLKPFQLLFLSCPLCWVFWIKARILYCIWLLGNKS